MRAISPGEVLEIEFLKPLGLSANQLAKAMHVPTNRITYILKGTRAITADTALRLSKVLGTSPDMWLNLQKTFDLKQTEELIREELASIHRIATVPLKD